MLFANKIKELRESKQMLQRHISAALDMDNAMYCKIEKGDRKGSIEMIPVVAKLFNLDYQGLQVDILSDKLLEENKDYPLLNEALKEALNKLKRAK